MLPGKKGGEWSKRSGLTRAGGRIEGEKRKQKMYSTIRGFLRKLEKASDKTAREINKNKEEKRADMAERGEDAH